MMRTPICDFVKQYAASNPCRLHMPGHKGRGPLGLEALDITEIDGADSLYEASGIIAESEQNASRLFGYPTFYSAEGSSLAIRAMLLLSGARKVVAARNVHKTFLSACALLDLDVSWLFPKAEESYHACSVTPEEVETAILAEQPQAVYLTSPDYLGNVADIRGVAEVCHRHGVLLLVDNAHGAYLKFLAPSRHPMDLGADLCCDSAHKTLPVLTGGAYLHVSRTLFDGDPARIRAQAKAALALFGSTSPSYLILQSLDAANPYMEDHGKRLAAFLPRVNRVREALQKQGFVLIGEEPLKITLRTKPYGYTGDAVAAELMQQGVCPEFHDPDFLVLMPAPENEDLEKVQNALCALPCKQAIPESVPAAAPPVKRMKIREAALGAWEWLPVQESEGRILAQATVGCPPAVPILMSGEQISREAIGLFRYYGIETVCVVKGV